MSVCGGDGVRRDYIPLILETMTDCASAQRKIACKTGISKSRLGVILHRNPDKRSPMTLDEFEAILQALDIDMVQAYIRLETLQGLEVFQRARYATLIAMLCEAFVGLPKQLITMLDELEGIDGSEVRKEWASPLQKAVIRRIIEEVTAVMERRSRIAESDDFRI